MRKFKECRIGHVYLLPATMKVVPTMQLQHVLNEYIPLSHTRTTIRPWYFSYQDVVDIAKFEFLPDICDIEDMQTDKMYTPPYVLVGLNINATPRPAISGFVCRSEDIIVLT
jgi:hypothetical protein